MRHEITVAGFGGQGILLSGQLIARAAMAVGRRVTLMSSYGFEMRGGTANCTAVISDREIYSPLVEFPDVVVAMNKPSLYKFKEKVKPGGTLLVNSSMVCDPAPRQDIRTFDVPATALAQELGSTLVANLVMLGHLVAQIPGIVSHEDLLSALEALLPEHRRGLMPLNREALFVGMRYPS